MKTTLIAALLGVAFSPHASAHLMVAQRGTLNFEGDGVYMVLSLPVSAFENIDDDGDGKLSATEFTTHRPAIVAAVAAGVQLQDAKGIRPLEGMMLSPVAPHDDPKASSDQLVVMGRFALADIQSDLQFQVSLFGQQADQQKISITATRKATSDKQKIKLTPEQPATELFSVK